MRTAALLAVLLMAGCTSQQVADFGISAGVIRESQIIPLPAKDVEEFFESGAQLAEQACAKKVKLCRDSKKPGAACKLPAAECRASEDACDKVDVLIAKGRKEFARPRVEWDVKGTARLLGQIVAIAKEIKP